MPGARYIGDAARTGITPYSRVSLALVGWVDGIGVSRPDESKPVGRVAFDGQWKPPFEVDGNNVMDPLVSAATLLVSSAMVLEQSVIPETPLLAAW